MVLILILILPRISAIRLIITDNDIHNTNLDIITDINIAWRIRGLSRGVISKVM